MTWGDMAGGAIGGAIGALFALAAIGSALAAGVHRLRHRRQMPPHEPPG